MDWQLVASYFTVNPADIFLQCTTSGLHSKVRTSASMIRLDGLEDSFVLRGYVKQHIYTFPCMNLKHQHTVELQWLEYLWNHKNMLETGVVRTNEC